MADTNVELAGTDRSGGKPSLWIPCQDTSIDISRDDELLLVDSTAEHWRLMTSNRAHWLLRLVLLPDIDVRVQGNTIETLIMLVVLDSKLLLLQVFLVASEVKFAQGILLDLFDRFGLQINLPSLESSIICACGDLPWVAGEAHINDTH